MVHGICATSTNSNYMNVNILLVYHSDFRSKHTKLKKAERNHVIQSYRRRNEKNVYAKTTYEIVIVHLRNTRKRCKCVAIPEKGKNDFHRFLAYF